MQGPLPSRRPLSQTSRRRHHRLAQSAASTHTTQHSTHCLSTLTPKGCAPAARWRRHLSLSLSLSLSIACQDPGRNECSDNTPWTASNGKHAGGDGVERPSAEQPPLRTVSLCALSLIHTVHSSTECIPAYSLTSSSLSLSPLRHAHIPTHPLQMLAFCLVNCGSILEVCFSHLALHPHTVCV